MHTKNYVAFANAIREEREKVEKDTEETLEMEFNAGQLAGIEKMARRCAEIFRNDNERFNVDQFLHHAGVS